MHHRINIIKLINVLRHKNELPPSLSLPYKLFLFFSDEMLQYIKVYLIQDALDADIHTAYLISKLSTVCQQINTYFLTNSYVSFRADHHKFYEKNSCLFYIISVNYNVDFQ